MRVPFGEGWEPSRCSSRTWKGPSALLLKWRGVSVPRLKERLEKARQPLGFGEPSPLCSCEVSHTLSLRTCKDQACLWISINLIERRDHHGDQAISVQPHGVAATGNVSNWHVSPPTGKGQEGRRACEVATFPFSRVGIGDYLEVTAWFPGAKSRGRQARALEQAAKDSVRQKLCAPRLVP